MSYVSGILKEDYSEWLSERLLMGDAPDVFFVLPEDFNDLAELGALRALSPFSEEDEEFSRDRSSMRCPMNALQSLCLSTDPS